MKILYDACVVGTSPISLLTAIKLSKLQKKVIIIEKDSINGGAWSNEKMIQLGSARLETACHLIEHYSNVYRKLSDISGVPFKVCNPQPIKILKNNKIKNYFCPQRELRKILTQVGLLLALPFVKFINFFLPNKIQIGRNLKFKNLSKLIKFGIRYKLISIFSFNGIMEPIFGYSYFIEQLICQVKKNNVKIINTEFIDVYKLDNKNLEVITTKDKIEAKKIYLTESVEVKKESNLAEIIDISETYTKNKYWHVVIEVFEKIKKKIPTYINLPDDNIIHRMTKDNHLNIKTKRNIFLIQTRINPMSINHEILYKRVIEIFALFDVIVEQKNIKVLKFFEKSLFSSQKNSQFCNSRTKENIVIIRSIGDLGKNITLNSLFSY